MTRGVLELPSVPGKAPAGRTASRVRRLLCALVAVILALTLVDQVRAKPGSALPDGIVTEVKIEGNVSIPTDEIRRKILSRPGQELSQRQIDADLKSLHNTKWFSEENAYYQPDPKKPGWIVIFTVVEMPVLTHVEFRGRTKNLFGFYIIKQKDLEETTGLKVGNRADSMRTRLSVGQIQRLYAEKGYDLAEVRLVEGGNPGDTRVIIEIFEGEKRKVGHVDFEGNDFVTDERLRTKISSHPPRLGLIGGVFTSDTLSEDVRKLHQFYESQGFYEVKISPITKPGSSLGDTRITFVISEGIRYRVRNIKFEGNQKLSDAKLREGLLMHSGQPMLETIKDADRMRLLTKYYELGCINTEILATMSVTEEPGVMDVVYKIEEGDPYILGELIVKGNDRTQDRVIRREANMAGLLPGEVLNKNRMEGFKKRLMSLGYFQNAPDQNKFIDVKIVNGRKADRPYGDLAIPDIHDTTRLQSPAADNSLPPVAVPALPAGPPANAPAGPGLAPFVSGGNMFNPPPDTLPQPSVPALPSGPSGAPPMVLPPGTTPTPAPVGTGEPKGMFPSIPGMNATDVGPDRGDAFSNRQIADIITSVDEGPTGNLSLGLGASGAQGLSAFAMINERNFNFFNFPTSFADITNGQAFRGGGQQLQISAMVGTLINRFQMSLIDRYLFDLPITGGATGYVFNRIYPDWSEIRGGGRFWLGRQFGPVTYGDFATRIENVDFFGYRSPAPAAYLAAAGHTTLFSLRPSLRFDNRNAMFMPNKGQYVDFSFEQGFGSFIYSKAEVEGRTYFTLGSRPDGSGNRTLELRGHYGITGPDTPVYERFFAGYIGSLRGFQYRGVGPHILGSNVGGLMEALGSIEYMFPLTASDSVRQVIFTDFGTVTSNYEINNFRASVGTGLRLTIPAMGPLPLAFDLAFPVLKAPGDHVNYFNFSIGAQY